MLILRSPQPPDKVIKDLGPAAWFRAGWGQTVTGSGVSQWDDISGNARHLKQGTDANRPVSLLHSGTNYLYLPGVVGNYASTPDSVANSITGDIDIRVRVSLDDWTPASTRGFVGKDAASNRSYSFYVLSTGRFQFFYTSDGTTTAGRVATSSVAPTVSDGAAIWVRVTYANATGKVNFYQAADSAAVPSSWTAVGTEQTITSGAIFDGNSALVAGAGDSAGGSQSAGKIYRASIYSTIGGTTPVVDFNPSDATDQAASFVSSTTGETWTINSTGSKPAQIVGRSSLLFDGAAHFLKCDAFTLNQPTTVLMVVKQVSWANADYICDGNAAVSGVILQNSVSPGVRISAGSVVGDNTGPAIGAWGVVSAVFNGASSSIQINAATPVTGNAGAANMGGFTLGARADGTVSWSNIQVAEVILLPIALDATQRARAVRYLMGAWGIA